MAKDNINSSKVSRKKKPLYIPPVQIFFKGWGQKIDDVVVASKNPLCSLPKISSALRLFMPGMFGKSYHHKKMGVYDHFKIFHKKKVWWSWTYHTYSRGTRWPCYVSYIRHKDFLLRPPSFRLRLSALDFETDWTGDLWSKTNLLKLRQ